MSIELKSGQEAEAYLAELTRKVASLRATFDAAQVDVTTAEAGLAEANRILPTDPSEANRKAVKAATAKLDKARQACGAAERAWREAHNEEEIQTAAHLRAKQSAFARQILVEKRAAKSPEIMELLEESKAKGIAIEGMREKIEQESKARHAAETDLAKAKKDLAAAEAELAKVKKELAAAMKAKPEVKPEAGA